MYNSNTVLFPVLLLALLLCACTTVVRCDIVFNDIGSTIRRYDTVTGEITEFNGGHECTGYAFGHDSDGDTITYCSAFGYPNGSVSVGRAQADVSFSNLTLVSDIVPTAHMIQVIRGYAFVTDAHSKLFIVRLEDGSISTIAQLNECRGIFIRDDRTLLISGRAIYAVDITDIDSPVVSTLVPSLVPAIPPSKNFKKDTFSYGITQYKGRVFWTQNCGIFSARSDGSDVTLWRTFPCSDGWTGPYGLVSLNDQLYWTRGERSEAFGNYFESAPIESPHNVSVHFKTNAEAWLYDVVLLNQ